MVYTIHKTALTNYQSTLCGCFGADGSQLAFFKSQLATWHFESDDSIDPTVFTDANLDRYAAVAMVNTCFEPFGAG